MSTAKHQQRAKPQNGAKQRNIEDAYPLAPIQEGLLFHSLYAPNSGVYVTQVACTFGNLNVAALKGAWTELLAHHPILRTAFVWKDLKHPLQVVGRKVELPLVQEDWRHLSSDLQAARWQTLLQQDRARGFVLSKAPLMRLTLVQISDRDYRFLWSHHHILLDGWSVHHLISQLFALYAASCRGERAQLPPARPYKEYIAWLQSQDKSVAERFWRRTLAGLSAPTALDIAKSVRNGDGNADSPHAPPHHYAEARRTLSRAATTELRALTRAHQVTLNIVLQGALALLLSRYSGSSDLLFGAVVAGRPPKLMGVEKMVGLFVNTLPVRVQVSASATVRTWLQLLQDQQVEMRDVEYSPLVEVHGWSDFPRDQALFNTLFVFENYPVDAPAVAELGLGLEIRDYQVVEQVNYPLTIAAGGGDELSLKVLYDSERFDAATIERFLDHWQRILAQMAADAERPLATIDLLTNLERHELVVTWNETGTAYPHDRSIHDLFAARAAATPDAIAVTFPTAQLTYRELNERANRVAHHLQQLGVGAETCVGICMERSLEIIVGILGILKAGGTYLPLDPAYPAARLATMLEDAQPPVLLTHAAAAATLAAAVSAAAATEISTESSRSTLVNLTTDWPEIGQQSTTNPQSGTSGEHLAYIMYTSGSTGRPKGIAIPHRAILRLVCNTNYVAFGPELRIGMVSNTAFDAATFELWGALLHGAQLIGVPKAVALAPTDFAAYIQEQGIDTLFLTTALFNQMAREAPSAFRSLRHLLFGGEAVDPRWVRAVREQDGPERLLHVYGPTESTTFTTWYPVQQVAVAAHSVPIGRPIANTQTYVLDRRMQPVPVGVLGELYIGGDGLARDYLHRPALTAEKFVPNPFARQPGARLYKTGDLVRYQSDGAIEFIGRIDHQVKLRGFRIELREIEALLTDHTAVEAAVVVVDEMGAAGKRLIAYLVAGAGAVPTVNELRGYLQTKLPDYMVPAIFVWLDALPLNANGKVDRKALPAPEEAHIDAESFVAPRTPTEEIIAAIWSQLLAVPRVSVAESFFDLGGHSLLATQVTSRLTAAFDVEVPLRDLFEAATVAALAMRIEARLQQATNGPVPAIEPASRDDHLPLSFGQQRLWFVEQLTPDGSAYNFHAALRLSGKLDVTALQAALDAIVQRHEVLRTTFAVADGQPVQVLHPPASLPVATVDLRDRPAATREAELQRQIDAESRRPFDLARGPLLRVTLWQLGAQEHVVTVVKHHIITDGWAMGLFVREFATLYAAHVTATTPRLPALPIQYADFAAWQRQWMTGDVLAQHVTYWRRQLAALPLLKLPTDRPRPPEQTFRGARATRALSSELSDALHLLSRQEGVTLFMTLLAAFKTLLAHMANQEDIVVGADIANRNRAETEHLIGFFANQLVLRTDLAGNPTFRELLGRVRKVALGAYAHQDLSFEKLVEVLQPARDASRNPLFQVMFILQNAPAAQLDLPDLTVSPMAVTQETTAFDITLSIIEEVATEQDGQPSAAALPDGEAQPQRIRLACRYYRDIFEPATIERMLINLEELLNAVIAEPNTRLSDLTRSLAVATEAAPSTVNRSVRQQSLQKTTLRKENDVDTRQRKPSKFDSLLKVKPKSVSLSQAQLVEQRYVHPEQSLPLVLQPTAANLDLGDWAAANHALIAKELASHGAILFRGFAVESVAKFEKFTRILAPELMDYSERSSPRSKVSGAVYTSTDHPADQPIVLHNEQSYTRNWMMKLWFYCAQQATTGGRTPIADSRKILQRLSPETVAQFERKEWMYVRNYGIGMGLPWHEAFQTDDRAVVQEFCRNADIQCEWLDDGRLRTRQIRPAIHQHPTTGDAVWFNHVLFFHISSLEAATRESLLAGLAEEDLPFNTYYGDGTPIEPTVMEEIRAAYAAQTVSFPWQQGDILMLDNMLVAHGREPFTGQRKIVVAMAEPYAHVAQSSAASQIS